MISDGRFAGVDWASEEHALCVVDEQGRIVEGRRYRHREPRVRALCGGLVRVRVALVALERPDGLLIGWLLGAGLAVIAVHRNQVEAMRPRFSVAGGKSDGFDSLRAGRARAHRQRSLPGAGARPRPDQGAARDHPGAGRAGAHPGRAGQPAARSARQLLAGSRERVLRGRFADRARVSAPLPDPLDARRLGEQRLDAFPERHGHPGANPPASCSPGYGRGRKDAPASSRPKPGASSCWRSSRRSSRSSPASAS